MRSFLLSSLLLSSTALASQLYERTDSPSLVKRQTPSAFPPSLVNSNGNSCSNAFNSSYLMCHDKTPAAPPLCYAPSLGQSCCQNSWACPAGSSCGANNQCKSNSSPSSSAVNVPTYSSPVVVAPSASIPSVQVTVSYPVATGTSGSYSAYFNGTIPSVTAPPYTWPSTFTGTASISGLNVVALAGALLVSVVLC